MSPMLSLVLLTLSMTSTAEKSLVSFWQITDIHYDKFYAQHGDVTQFCHGDNGYAPQFGDYNCETNEKLFISALENMADAAPEPDFILWTGDSSPHWKEPDSPDWEYIYEAELFITNSIRRYFPNSTIVPVLGNHDAYEPDNYTNSELFHADDVSKNTNQMYMTFLSKAEWNMLIPSGKAQESFGFCGFYVREFPQFNLNVVVLNTNLYYKTNITQNDPCSQLEWLHNVLVEAESKNVKVIVSAHVPPGYFERQYYGPFYDYKAGHGANEAFIDLINKFGHVIVAQIFGHSHTDSFRLFTEQKSGELEYNSLAFMSPSITPLVNWQIGTNPGTRLYHYKLGESHLHDYDQFYTDLAQDNANGSIEWQKLYSFTEAYGVENLSIENMIVAFDKISYNYKYFTQAYVYNTLLYSNGPCDSNCRLNYICSLTNLKVTEMEKCYKPKDDDSGSLIGDPMSLLIGFIIGVVAFSVGLVLYNADVIVARRWHYRRI